MHSLCVGSARQLNNRAIRSCQASKGADSAQTLYGVCDPQGGLSLVPNLWTFWFITHPLTFSTQSHPKIHPEHMLWIAWARFESSQTSPQAMVTIYITVLQLLDDCVLWVDGGRTVESCCAGVYQGCAGVLGCQSRAVRNVLKQCSGPDCLERSYYLVLLAG